MEAGSAAKYTDQEVRDKCHPQRSPWWPEQTARRCYWRRTQGIERSDWAQGASLLLGCFHGDRLSSGPRCIGRQGNGVEGGNGGRARD